MPAFQAFGIASRILAPEQLHFVIAGNSTTLLPMLTDNLMRGNLPTDPIVVEPDGKPLAQR